MLHWAYQRQLARDAKTLGPKNAVDTTPANQAPAVRANLPGAGPLFLAAWQAPGSYLGTRLRDLRIWK